LKERRGKPRVKKKGRVGRTRVGWRGLLLKLQTFESRERGPTREKVKEEKGCIKGMHERRSW